MLLVHGPLDSGRTYTSGFPDSQAPGLGPDLQGLSLRSRGASQARDHVRQALRARLSLYLHLPRGCASQRAPAHKPRARVSTSRGGWPGRCPFPALFLWHVLAMFTNHRLVLGRALLTMRPGGQDAPDMMGALKPSLDT